jgi:hypothetical protein
VGGLALVESPANKALTLLANDGLDDVAAAVVDAVDPEGGGGSLPVNPPNEEHAASVTASAATPVVILPTLPRQRRGAGRRGHGGSFCTSTSPLRTLRFRLLM